MKVRANAETPADARVAREFGAEGIGLCRTEHMFFEGERIIKVREMVLAEDEKGRRAALDKLLPIQRKDFTEIFEVMAGLPVTIRLLDPPLHEFLPKIDEEIGEFAEVATAAGVERRHATSARAAELHEFNPMLGHRGCRLWRDPLSRDLRDAGPRDLRGGGLDVAEKSGAAPIPEVMIPLVATRRELEVDEGVCRRQGSAGRVRQRKGP